MICSLIGAGLKDMIGSLIGAGLSAVGGIVGGIQSAKANRQAQEQMAQQKAKNQAWYDKNYNTDYTQRSDAQAILNRTKELAQQNRQRAQASAVVTGATDESIALQNEANNKMVSDTMSQIASQADRYKQGVENQFLSTDSALAQQEQARLQQRASDGANATSTASGALAGIVGSIFDKDK